MNTTLPYRLPRTVIPNSYNLTIAPQTSQPYELKGEVQINMTVIKTTSCIVIHQNGLSFSKVELKTNTNTITPTSINYDAEHQFAILNFSNNIESSETSSMILTIQYDGYLNQNNATGFFVSPLELTATPTTQEEHSELMKQSLANTDIPTMLATQFEGPYARMAYPCFDEPELKAVFGCKMIVENTPGITVLFNTKEVSSYVNGSDLITIFEDTPVPISTYLIAFAVGTFEYIEQTNNNIRYRIYSSPGKSQYGAFSLNITIETINYFTNLWSIGYPLNKLDQIAVPRIFQDGMENIGLVTYWPPWLLDVPGNTSIADYQMTTMVVTHELSHMWFGDTVTLPWWSETYNNEGFARYLQYIAAEYLFPEWNVWEQGGKNSWFNFVYNIMKQDATGTLPSEILFQNQVSGSVDSVKNSFSGPTYPKGACLNRYFNDYLGDTIWNNALSYHLNKWKYQNPTTYELIFDLDYYTNFELQLREKFIPWLRLQSFPVLSLDVVEEDNQFYLVLSQTPVSKYINHYSAAVWFINVPITLYSQDYDQQTTFNISFSGKELSQSIDAAYYYDETYIANEEHTSYLVTKYSNQLWSNVLQYYSNSNDEVMREVFLQDIFILTRMSHTTVAVPLEFTSYTSSLTSTTYWPALFTQWFQITIAIQTQDYYLQFLYDLSSSLMSIVDYSLQLDASTSDLQSLQSSVLFWSAFYEITDSINNAISLFDDNDIPSYLQKYVYTSVGRYGSDDQYASLTSIALNSNLGVEQTKNAQFGLVTTLNQSRCDSTLSSFKSVLSTNDYLTLCSNMLFYSSSCQSIAWAQIVQYSEDLLSTNGSSSASFVLNLFNGAFSTYQDYLNVDAFLQQNSQYFTEQEIQNALTMILINIDIVQSNLNFPDINYNVY